MNGSKLSFFVVFIFVAMVANLISAQSNLHSRAEEVSNTEDEIPKKLYDKIVTYFNDKFRLFESKFSSFKLENTKMIAKSQEKTKNKPFLLQGDVFF